METESNPSGDEIFFFGFPFLPSSLEVNYWFIRIIAQLASRVANMEAQLLTDYSIL